MPARASSSRVFQGRRSTTACPGSLAALAGEGKYGIQWHRCWFGKLMAPTINACRRYGGFDFSKTFLRLRCLMVDFGLHSVALPPPLMHTPRQAFALRLHF